MVHRRDLNGEKPVFGNQGALWGNAMTWWDHGTGSVWSQPLGEAILGPRKGDRLELFPSSMTTWGAWRDAHPDTLVLSTDTGFDKDYSVDRYANYRESDGLMFPVNQEDGRVHPKSVVFGFNVAGKAVAYTESLLQEQPTYRHEFDGAEHVVTLRADGTVKLRRGEDTLEPIRLYWFAWYTFNPQTELVK